MERGFIGLDIAVLAISDASMSLASEPPAQLILDRVALAGHRVYAQAVVAENVAAIAAKYREWIDNPAIDVVLVTAGANSDAASEALAPLMTRPIPGFTDLFRYLTFDEIGTAAMLVDAAAAKCKSTFVFVLPASIGAVRTALDKLLLPQLDYRTKPHNLVMRMPRHHAEGLHEVTGPIRTPWIVAREQTGPIPTFRPTSRSKTPTTNVAVPLKPPAPIVPRPSRVEEAIAAVEPVVEAAPVEEIVDELEPDAVESSDDIATAPIAPPPVPPRRPGPITIDDAPMREAILSAQQRAVTETVTPLEDPPRRVAIMSRKREKRRLALVGAAITLASVALVVLVIIARHGTRRETVAEQRPEQVAQNSPPPHVDEPVAEPPPPPVDAAPERESVEPPTPTPMPTPTPSSTKVRPPRPAVPRPRPRTTAPVIARAPVAAGCDEVSCVLGHYQRACCVKFKPADPTPAVRSSALPASLVPAMVKAGMAKVKPGVIRCGELAGVKGTVKITVTVSPAGAVTNAAVASAPDATLGACVAGVVRKASFDKTGAGGAFNYPFVF